MFSSIIRNESGRLYALALGLVFLMAIGPLEARAQEAPQVYEHWSIVCNANQAGQRECLMYQDIIADGTDQSIMRVTVVKTPQSALIVTTPLGVILPQGLILAIDQQEASRMQYQICIEPGCRAQIDLAPELVQRLKSGVGATVTIVGPNNQPIAVPVSLKGFTAAYDALT
ncbi:MAG: invasion associated locus B family protein [Xanthobacteraceae bacterium]